MNILCYIDGRVHIINAQLVKHNDGQRIAAYLFFSFPLISAPGPLAATLSVPAGYCVKISLGSETAQVKDDQSVDIHVSSYFWDTLVFGYYDRHKKRDSFLQDRAL